MPKAISRAEELSTAIQEFAEDTAAAKEDLAEARRLLAEAKEAPDRAAEELLADADALHVAWKRTRTEMETRAKTICKLWYRPTPNTARATLRTLYADYSKVNQQVRLLKERAKAPLSTAVTTVTAAPQEAMLVEVVKYVHRLFSGDEAKETILQEFRTWREGWMAADTKLRSSVGVSDGVLYTQLCNAILGTALDLVKRLPPGSYQAALDALNARYGDVYALAESYLPPQESTATKKERLREVGATISELKLLFPTLEEENVSREDFLLVTSTVRHLDPKSAKKWASDVAAKRRAAALDNPDAKIGDFVSADRFKAWVEEEAAKEEDEDDDKDNVFRVTATETYISGCVLCGPTAKHTTSVCTAVEKLSAQAWFDLSRKEAVCSRCLDYKWSREHLCEPRCSQRGCRDTRHIFARHNKAIDDMKLRRPKRAASAPVNPGHQAKRGRSAAPATISKADLDDAVAKALANSSATAAASSAPKGGPRGKGQGKGKGKGKGIGKSGKAPTSAPAAPKKG